MTPNKNLPHVHQDIVGTAILNLRTDGRVDVMCTGIDNPTLIRMLAETLKTASQPVEPSHAAVAKSKKGRGK